MGYQRITVEAPRRRPFDPEHPVNGPVLFDIDERHPGGQAYLAEGDRAEVYPTAEVNKRLGEGRLVKVDPKAPAQPAAIDPNSLWALAGLDDGTVKVLEGAGIGDVAALTMAWNSGDLQKTQGIGKGRLDAIRHALITANHIGEDA